MLVVCRVPLLRRARRLVSSTPGHPTADRGRFGMSGCCGWMTLTMRCLAVVLAFQQVSEVVASNQPTESFSSARCRVRCLTQLQLKNEASYELHDDITLATCRLDSHCDSCVRPCSQPFLQLHSCQDSCPNLEDVCLESCRFLKQINSIRPGTCPPETHATGSAALCINACQSDADCDHGLKCCSNSCGWTCQQPNHMHDGMPEVPDTPTVRDHRDDGTVELAWNAVSSNSSGVIVYVIEWRSSRHHDDTGFTWQQAAQVTGSSAIVGDIQAGHSYQFRVASVNVDGSQGWSLPTLAYTLAVDPSKPGPPVNVTEGHSKVVGATVSVSVHWLPPRTSDLPVTRYKLYWIKRVKNTAPNLTAFREYRQVLPADRLSFTITLLDPQSTYFIQVQAISQHREMKLKSDRASITITTASIQGQEDDTTELHWLTSSTRPSQSAFSIVRLAADTTFFHDGNLKANISWTTSSHSTEAGDDEEDEDELEIAEIMLVYWSPEACIADTLPEDGLTKTMSAMTKEDSYVIHDLRFGCRYLIRVERVSSSQGTSSQSSSSGVVAHLTISTPSCSSVIIIGSVKPDCPSDVEARIPSELTDLQHSFIISNSNITARLTWSTPTSSVPVTGYRVIWGQLVDPDNPSTDTASLTKVLHKDARFINLNGLLSVTTYTARIQALSVNGAGHPTSIQFTTPMLQTASNDPPYNQLHLDQRQNERRLQTGGRRKQEIVTSSNTIMTSSTTLRQTLESVTSQSLRDRSRFTVCCLALTFLLQRSV